MSLTAGIVGLPNAGKSTLFSVITKASTEMIGYPFATIEPNAGMVEIPDSRSARIDELIPAKEIIHTILEFTDIVGLVKGASKGEGLGNKFLENIRQIDVIIHVVCFFNGDNTASVIGKVDPKEDISTVNLEPAIVDLDAVNRRIGKAEKLVKGNDKDAKARLAVLQKIRPVLGEGKAVGGIDFKNDERKIVKGLFLLTPRPVIYVANIAEDSMAGLESDKYFQVVRKHAEGGNAGVIAVSATIEEKTVDLDDDEKRELLETEGVTKSGLDRLIKATYHLLGLRTFSTAGDPETCAWTLHEGMKAPQVTGVIRSDFEREFIRVEVMSFDDLDKHESMQKVKEADCLCLEGKDYVVQDGGIIGFRLNV